MGTPGGQSAKCDAAFDLLEHGLSDVTDRPAG